MAIFTDIPRPNNPDTKQLANYMYQLEDMLRHVLQNIDKENISEKSELVKVLDDDNGLAKKVKDNTEELKNFSSQAWKLNSGIASYETTENSLKIVLHDGRTITFTKAPVTLEGVWSGTTYTVTASDGGRRSTTIGAAQYGNNITVWADNSPGLLIQFEIDKTQLT